MNRRFPNALPCALALAIAGASPAFADDSKHKVKGEIKGLKIEILKASIGQVEYTPPTKSYFLPTEDDYLKLSIKIKNESSKPIFLEKSWTDTECIAGSQIWRIHDMASIILVKVKGDVFNQEIAPGAEVVDLLAFRGVERDKLPTKRLKVTAHAPLFRNPGMVAIKKNEIKFELDPKAITLEERKTGSSGGGGEAGEAEEDKKPAGERVSPEDELLAARLKPLFRVEPKVKGGVVTLEYFFNSEEELKDFRISKPEWTSLQGGLVGKKAGKILTRAEFTDVEVSLEMSFGYLSQGTSSFILTLAEHDPGDYVGLRFGKQAVLVRKGRIKKAKPKISLTAFSKQFRVFDTYTFSARFDCDINARFPKSELTGAFAGKKCARLTNIKSYGAGAIGVEYVETNFTIQRLVIKGKVDPSWLARQPAPGDGG